MIVRNPCFPLLITLLFLSLLAVPPAPACCPAPPSGKPVVNADQTVILIWDPATKMEHFIRKASFKSEADDFGFIVPSPTRPQLDESGNEAFPVLQKVTEPETITRPRSSGGGCIGCGLSAPKVAGLAAPEVRVLEEKNVAGFKATVLEADTAEVLVQWLKTNGYAYSPEVQAWAKPYVESGWKFTALKVAKPEDGKKKEGVATPALRISFKTDRPLFPYREPDPKKSAEALSATSRLLRIYFLSDGRYQGELTKEVPWTGRVAWAGQLTAEDRKKTLELLKLPDSAAPAQCWLTEFEDSWPYRSAPADVYFARSGDQSPVKRPPIIHYVYSPWPADGMVYVFALTLCLSPLIRRIGKAGSDGSNRKGSQER